jgi:hypothetical protein
MRVFGGGHVETKKNEDSELSQFELAGRSLKNGIGVLLLHLLIIFGFPFVIVSEKQKKFRRSKLHSQGRT